jgi:soluble lytic murein transglycosylase-like protein
MHSVLQEDKLIACACAMLLGLAATPAAAAPDSTSRGQGERQVRLAVLERPSERLERAIEVQRARAAYRDARDAARDAGAELERNLLAEHRPTSEELREAAERLDETARRLREREREREAAAEAVSGTVVDDAAIASPESYGVSTATLEAIAACESGGDPTAVSADGTYRGKYQFDYATWASVGGAGDPAAAPEAEQDMRAAMLYAQAGSSPWPVCG